jgi:hypothetical protein
MKNRPVYVLLIEYSDDEPFVTLHQSLDDAEDALREIAARIWAGPQADEDMLEVFAKYGHRVRVFACTMKRNVQTSTEITPFARKAASSGDQLSLPQV